MVGSMGRGARVKGGGKHSDIRLLSLISPLDSTFFRSDLGELCDVLTGLQK